MSTNVAATANALMRKVVERYCKLRLLPYVFNENNQLQSSRIRYWTSLIVCSIISLGMLLVLLLRVSLKKLKENPFYLIGYARVLLTTCYMIMSSVVFLIRHHFSALEIFNECTVLDTREHLSSKEFIQMRRAFRLHTGFFATFGIITAITSAYSIGSISIYLWPLIIPAIFVSVAPDSKTFHFMATLTSLEGRILNVTNRLEMIGQEQRNVCFVKEEFQIPWVDNSFKVMKTIRCTNDCLKVRELRKYSARVHNLKKKVNDVYGFHILVLILSAFFESVFYFFWNLTIFQYAGKETRPINIYQYVYISGYTVGQIIKVVLLVSSCQSWKDKVSDLDLAVQNALVRVHDEETIKELLSMDLQHRGNSISAGGFCDVDNGLLREMAGSVSMYIIILIQFKFTVNLNEVDPSLDMIQFF